MKLPWLLLHPIWSSVCPAMCEYEQLLLSKQAHPLQMLPQYWVAIVTLYTSPAWGLARDLPMQDSWS